MHRGEVVIGKLKEKIGEYGHWEGDHYIWRYGRDEQLRPVVGFRHVSVLVPRVLVRLQTGKWPSKNLGGKRWCKEPRCGNPAHWTGYDGRDEIERAERDAMIWATFQNHAARGAKVNLAAIAREIGVTRSRVQQIVASQQKALGKSSP